MGVANTTPGADEIRLRTGVHEGGLLLANQDLTISGLDAMSSAPGILSSTPSPRWTTRRWAAAMAPSAADLAGASRIEGLTFARGEGSPGGGGLDVRLAGGGRLEIENVDFRDNGPPGAAGCTSRRTATATAR